MELKMARQTDWNALIRAVLLIGMTAFLARIILSGDIGLYIHPKFKWFTASAGLGMSLMAVGQLLRGLQGTTGYVLPLRAKLYAAFVTVLAVGFIFRPITFGADLAAKQGLNITNRTGTKAPADAPAPAVPETTAPSQTPQADPVPAVPAVPQGGQGGTPTLTGETLVVTNQNFFSTMNELYGNPVKYVGKRAVLEGFIFYLPDTNPQAYTVTRLVVTCHVAHAAPDGLIIHHTLGELPPQDAWYRAEGVLEPYQFKGTATLRLKVEKLTPIAQPADPYVYP